MPHGLVNLPARLKYRTVNRIKGYRLVRDHTPLDRLTADQLRERAREYREMAATATSEATRDGLIRLAEQFEALALTGQTRAAAG